MRNAPCWLFLTVCLLGCAANESLLRERGMLHENRDYRIAFSNPEKRVFISEDWYIDNFAYKDYRTESD